MADETGFSTMGRAESAGTIPEIGVGMLGYAFMGTAGSTVILNVGCETSPGQSA